MSKETRPNTYVRIMEASLFLFNEEGERNISTNHIAAHLGISPGNLYYHFRNKEEIIVQIHHKYSAKMMACIKDAGEPKELEDLIQHLGSIFNIMWEYRFLFSDTNSLLARNAELLGSHNEFTREKAAPLVLEYLMKLAQNGVVRGDKDEMQSLALNMWIMSKYWFDFHGTVRGRHKLQEESTKQLGILRNLSLIRPYVTETYREQLISHMDKLQKFTGHKS